MNPKRKVKRQLKQHRIPVAILAVALVAVLSVGVLRSLSGPRAATVQFYSSGALGYACFLNGVQNEQGGPYCLSDDPATMLPPNATIPPGNYTIVFFPFGTASNRTLWLATNNIQIIATGEYDVSSGYANVTVKGNGAIIVFVLPETTAIPEFPSTATLSILVLAVSLALLRRPT